jgi:hypothetical protein
MSEPPYPEGSHCIACRHIPSSTHTRLRGPSNEWPGVRLRGAKCLLGGPLPPSSAMFLRVQNFYSGGHYPPTRKNFQRSVPEGQGGKGYSQGNGKR